VCRCILSNYERKENRKRRSEQVGLYRPQWVTDNDAPWAGSADAALGAVDTDGGGAHSVEESAGTDLAFGSLVEIIEIVGRDRRGGIKPEARLAARIIPLVFAGNRRGEIAEVLGIDPSRVGRALSFLRRAARVWDEDEGIREAIA